MAETRVVKRIFKDGELIEEITTEISDEQLAVEQMEAEVQKANDNALNAYQNFDSLTPAQKNKILKGLLGDFIHRNRDNYI